jgi:hypothetical protein
MCVLIKPEPRRKHPEERRTAFTRNETITVSWSAGLPRQANGEEEENAATLRRSRDSSTPFLAVLASTSRAPPPSSSRLTEPDADAARAQHSALWRKAAGAIGINPETA